MEKNKNQGGLEGKISNPFKKLRNHIGKKVRVDYIKYGSLCSEESTLRNVEDYVNIEIESCGIPFVGYGSAIQRITDKRGNVLYENPNILNDYDVRSSEKIEDIVSLTFGQNIADKKRKERIKFEKDFEKRMKKSDEHAKTKANDYLQQGKSLVKRDVLYEWELYVKRNTQDGYSAAVVDASLKVMKALSDGKTSKKALDLSYELGLTVAMAGFMASTISHFHPRGEEFRKYWNKKFGLKDAKSKGVVNPAILIVRLK